LGLQISLPCSRCRTLGRRFSLGSVPLWVERLDLVGNEVESAARLGQNLLLVAADPAPISA
jgi:hypothetical protein